MSQWLWIGQGRKNCVNILNADTLRLRVNCLSLRLPPPPSHVTLSSHKTTQTMASVLYIYTLCAIGQTAHSSLWARTLALGTLFWHSCRVWSGHTETVQNIDWQTDDGWLSQHSSETTLSTCFIIRDGYSAANPLKCYYTGFICIWLLRWV